LFGVPSKPGKSGIKNWDEEETRMIQGVQVRHLKVGTLKLEVHPSGTAAGVAAARAVAEFLQRPRPQDASMGVIFATGTSQLFMLQALTSIPGFPWDCVCGFHLDEYVGLPADHLASFRRYLREHLTQLVPIREFHEIDGTAADLDRVCQEYTAKLRSCAPQLCLLGIGENGHLAFNDPDEADFEDPQAMRIVQLDKICRQQQLAEGWFQGLEEVPKHALTLTIPTIMQVPKLIVSVPGKRKAQVVRKMLEGPITTNCPASVLRTHPDATVYLDQESAVGLEDLPTQ
jgi:glucosamine-6-phosphate deaminase